MAYMNKYQSDDYRRDELIRHRRVHVLRHILGLGQGHHAPLGKLLSDDGPGAEASFTVKKLANEPEKADAKESGKTPTGEKAATKGAKSPSTGDNLPIGATAAAAIAAIALSGVALGAGAFAATRRR